MADKVLIGIFIFIGICVIGLGTIFILAINSGEECASDPFMYGAQQLRENNQVEVVCSCTTTDPNVAPFTFGADGYSQGSTPILAVD